jgi:hypothetical protein
MQNGLRIVDAIGLIQFPAEVLFEDSDRAMFIAGLPESAAADGYRRFWRMETGDSASLTARES